MKSSRRAELPRQLAAACLLGFCGPAMADAGQLALGTWELAVNTRAVDGAVFGARDTAGRLYLDESALRNWRVSLPGAERVEVDGVALLRVDAVPGARHEVDERRQSIALNFPPERLAGTRFDARPADRTPAAQAPHWGGFFNYSLFGYTSSGSGSDLAGLFEAAVFGPQGTGIASFGVNTATTMGPTGSLVRFDTSWRRDEPGAMRSLVVGDSISRPGFYGRSVRLGGIQYGRNFTLQPGFIGTPLLGFSGTAAVPSTVDVFVNNQRLASQPVEAGPFSIDNVPSISGSGTVQLVVRDAFGQQQVISQSLYGSPVLLAPGVDDYAFSLGAQRRNYGIESADYGGAQGMALWRRGLSGTLTAEARAEADETTRSAGVASDFLVGKIGVGSLGVAASSSDMGGGGLWLAGFEHQGRRHSLGLRGTFTSRSFRQVGDDSIFTTPRSNIIARAAANFGAYGSVSMAVVSQRFHEPTRPGIDTGTVTWSGNLGRRATLSMSLSRVLGAVSDTTLFASLNIPIGRDTSASVGTVSGLSGLADAGRQYVSLQKPLPAYGEGEGYRVFASSDKRVEAGAAFATRIARISAEAAQAHGTSALRVAVEGGVGAVGGHSFMSRPIVDSFAVVSAGGMEGLEVKQENQSVGRTDRNGLLVLTPLRAYVPNKLSIDPLSAPMNVGVGTDAQQVVPMWRSGVKVSFDVKRGRSALVRLLAADGKPLPASARVLDASTGQTLPVGVDGEVFLSGLPDAGTRLTVQSGERRCEIAVVPEGDDLVLELGPYACKGGA